MKTAPILGVALGIPIGGWLTVKVIIPFIDSFSLHLQNYVTVTILAFLIWMAVIVFTWKIKSK